MPTDRHFRSLEDGTPQLPAQESFDDPRAPLAVAGVAARALAAINKPGGVKNETYKFGFEWRVNRRWKKGKKEDFVKLDDLLERLTTDLQNQLANNAELQALAKKLGATREVDCVQPEPPPSWLYEG